MSKLSKTFAFAVGVFAISTAITGCTMPMGSSTSLQDDNQSAPKTNAMLGKHVYNAAAVRILRFGDSLFWMDEHVTDSTPNTKLVRYHLSRAKELAKSAQEAYVYAASMSDYRADVLMDLAEAELTYASDLAQF